jgi:hypothetical protein
MPHVFWVLPTVYIRLAGLLVGECGTLDLCLHRKKLVQKKHGELYRLQVVIETTNPVSELYKKCKPNTERPKPKTIKVGLITIIIM